MGLHGTDRTAGLIHYAIGDSASTLRVGPHLTVTHTAGPEDQSCPRPVAELWRSDISERSCADVRVTSGVLCIRAQVTAVPL
jgi:hypothetical protein